MEHAGVGAAATYLIVDDEAVTLHQIVAVSRPSVPVVKVHHFLHEVSLFSNIMCKSYGDHVDVMISSSSFDSLPWVARVEIPTASLA